MRRARAAAAASPRAAREAATRETSEWERETRVVIWRRGTRSAEACGGREEAKRRKRTRTGRTGRGARRRREAPVRVIGELEKAGDAGKLRWAESTEETVKEKGPTS
jgi:hypothetical protein